MGITNLNYKSKMKVSTITLILMLWMLSSYQTESVFDRRQLNLPRCQFRESKSDAFSQYSASRVCEGFSEEHDVEWRENRTDNSCRTSLKCQKIRQFGNCYIEVTANSTCQGSMDNIYRPNDDRDNTWSCGPNDRYHCVNGTVTRRRPPPLTGPATGDSHGDSQGNRGDDSCTGRECGD